jgi:hypothetical protein
MWTTFRRLIKRAFCSRHKGALVKYRVALDTPMGAWYDAERHTLNMMLIDQKM